MPINGPGASVANACLKLVAAMVGKGLPNQPEQLVPVEKIGELLSVSTDWAPTVLQRASFRPIALGGSSDLRRPRCGRLSRRGVKDLVPMASIRPYRTTS